MIASDLFLRPEALPALLLAPLAWAVLFALDRARTRRLRTLIGPRFPQLAVERSPHRRAVRRAAFACALLLAILAAVGPAFGAPVGVVAWRGVDVVVCLDVSRSMLARDTAPDRLGRAQHEIRALARHVRGDRLGLVVFAGDARLVVPLTEDATSFAALAELADPSSVERGGTDLGAALETALTALEGRSGEHGAIVLLTDGEDLSGRGRSAAARCRDRGVGVHGVGFGTPLGSKIALPTGVGEAFLRDRAGADVVSALDAAGLARIAEVGRGAYLAADDVDPEPGALVRLYEDEIVPTARTAFTSLDRRQTENRFQWPLLVAFLLWMLGLWLTDRTRG